MAPEKLHRLLVKCGVEQIVDRTTNFMAACPYHDERSPSWGIRKESPHLFGCFACGAKGSIVKLLVDKLHVSKTKAAQIAEVNVTEILSRDIIIQVEPDAYEYTRLQIELEWDTFVPAAEAFRYLAKRGVNKQTAINLGVRYDFEKKRVLFPWRKNGKLVGFTGRTISKDEQYKMIPYGGTKKGNFLYVPATKFSLSKQFVLVEGEIDAALIYQNVTPNVAAFGFGSFTKAQQKQVLTWGPTRVVVATDDDDAGHRLARQVEAAIGENTRVSVACYDDFRPKDYEGKIDPGMLSAEQQHRLIFGAKSALSI